MAGGGPLTCARDGYTVVALRGELDVCTAADTVRTLTAHAVSGARIIVNLAELTFIDCSSLRELISVRARAQQAGGDLALADPQPIVLRLLLLTGMISLCPVFTSMHDAVNGGPAALLAPETAVSGYLAQLDAGPDAASA
jgi:anti-sigma B factor antagonist